MKLKIIILSLLIGVVLIGASVLGTIFYFKHEQKGLNHTQQIKHVVPISIKLFTLLTTIENSHDKIIGESDNIDTNTIQITLYAMINPKNKEAFDQFIKNYKPEIKNNILQTIILSDAQSLLQEKGKKELAQNITKTMNNTIEKEIHKKNIVQKVLFTNFIIE
jgi:flagellar basal body-associated protein FliL